MKKIMLTLLMAVACTTAIAQIPQPDPDTTSRHFLIVASIDNLQEISAARQAFTKAANQSVREFAHMMIKDHGLAEQKLLQLALSRGIHLPLAATGGIQPDINLKDAGTNFDKLYVHAMVSGHNSTVQMFENYAVNGKDLQVRAFAGQTLPTLKAHLATITDINKKLTNP